MRDISDVSVYKLLAFKASHGIGKTCVFAIVNSLLMITSYINVIELSLVSHEDMTSFLGGNTKLEHYVISMLLWCQDVTK